MLSPLVTNEGRYEVSLIVSTPQTKAPNVVSFVLSKWEANNTIIQVQAVRRVKDDIFDYQQTTSLKSALGDPINRTKTGIGCQTKWEI